MKKTTKAKKKSKPTGRQLVREIVDAHLTRAKGGEEEMSWWCFWQPRPPTPSCKSGPCGAG